MSIHPKHGKTKGLNPAPTGFIKAQGLIASRKISNPGSSWIYGSNQIIEHLPNPQNNQIIELHLIMKTDQKFHHCYPKYPTHVFKWIVPEGPLVGPLVGPGPKKTAWCCVRSCSKADDLNGWTSPTISSWAIDGGSWLFMAIHCYWDTMIFNISSI